MDWIPVTKSLPPMGEDGSIYTNCSCSNGVWIISDAVYNHETKQFYGNYDTGGNHPLEATHWCILDLPPIEDQESETPLSDLLMAQRMSPETWCYRLGIMLDDKIPLQGYNNPQRIELAIREFTKDEKQ